MIGIEVRMVVKLLLPLLLVVSCQGVKTTQKTSKMNDNFKTEDFHPESLGGTGVTKKSQKGKQVGIERAALDKTFLLQGSMIAQSVVARFNNMRSRLVRFVHKQDQLLMLESSFGHEVDSDIPQKLVLASFPVQKETPNTIYFDFSAGMSKLYNDSDWHAQDFEGSRYIEDATWKSYALHNAFVNEVVFDKEIMVIKQVGQISVTQGVTHNIPVEAVYYLREYKANPGFKPTRSYNHKGMGFFELAPKLNAEEDIVYATKFDRRKPIVFAMSANTPKEYREAIRAGVLYWNKAFGEEVLQVVDAPEGVYAPHHRYNVIQWIDWDSASLAYADAQMDPMTGETMHAQIFIPSVFVASGRKKAKAVLKKIAQDKLSKHQHQHADKGHMCSLSLSSLENNLQAVVRDKDLSDADIEKIAHLYLTDVIAHEVGHTLGLRHNFAGVTASNKFSLKNQRQVLATLLQEDSVDPELLTSSSVMDYQELIGSVVTGHILTHRKAALPYDQKAIQKLYYGKDVEDVPLFCTDSSRGKYADCKVFVTGKSPVASAVSDYKKMIEVIPYRLFAQYRDAKEESHRFIDFHVANHTPDPVSAAASVIAQRGKATLYMQAGQRSLQVRSTFPFINPMNQEEVTEKEEQYFDASFKEVGGAEAVLEVPDEKACEKMKEEFVSYLQNDEHEFDAQEMDVLKEQANLFFSKFSEKIVSEDVKQLARMRTLLHGDTAESAIRAVEKKAWNIISATKGEQSFEVTLESGAKTVNLPTFKYEKFLRKKACAMTKIKRQGENDTLTNSVRHDLHEKFKKMLLTAFQMNAKEFDALKSKDLESNPEVKKWFSDAQDILSALD
jgi:hypothetical protein